ncbi:glycosyltransferase family 4 protein [Shewanella sp. GutCb]|uniref:glycosyltransferase family 4 protein n=1 Tax=Shewanella sp. GutCb TaxID=2058315 RepID=UPI000C7A796C|nr:glycosyltransferase family 4 protein [Shewanella sp. GutCb]
MPRDIILLSNAYWPSIGGIENSLRHLAQEAQSVGDNVEIIVSDIGLDDTLKGHSTELVDDVLVTRYPLQPFKFKLLTAINILWSNVLLFRLLRQKKLASPDAIVIARFHFAAFIASLVGFKSVKYLVPSIFSEQFGHENTEPLSWSSRLRIKLKILLHSTVQRAALKKSNVFVFSETMKKQCASLVGDDSVQYSIVKPGVNTDRFYPVDAKERETLKRELNLPINQPIILFVGRFVKAKGVSLLIDAVANVSQTFHLVLIGAGEELKSYETKIMSLSLADKVSIIPPLRDVERYYRCADMFVMSSSYEPLGQTILEAFASGLPLVAFKKSATVNTATQELGMDGFITYANLHNEIELAKAINIRLLAVPEFDRKSLAEQSKAKFNWQKLYSDLVR